MKKIFFDISISIKKSILEFERGEAHLYNRDFNSNVDEEVSEKGKRSDNKRSSRNSR